MPCEPHWTTVVSALLVPMVAVVGAWIAYRQSRTARNTLKYALFDRRAAVYDAGREFINAARHSRNSRKTREAEYNYRSGTRGAIWLFNADIARYLDEELLGKVYDLDVLEAEEEGLPEGEERSQNIQGQRAIREWLGEQLGVMEQKFRPFLKLEH